MLSVWKAASLMMGASVWLLLLVEPHAAVAAAAARLQRGGDGNAAVKR